MKSKISPYILRASTTALLISCVIVALCSAIDLPNDLHKGLEPQNNTNSDATRSLSFADRVAYQTAIEDVYWRHRIWPKTNPSPKPPLTKVMAQADIEKKVEAYLRNFQALEAYWQRRITAEQLQAEIERMARDTRQPEVLQELFEALGNDPVVIAECLARPTLTERLIGDVLAKDKAGRFESLRTYGLQMPREEVAAIDSTPNAFGVQVNRPYQLPVIANPSGGCTDDTWTPTTPTGAPSARFYHTAVWTGSEMIVWGGNNGAGSFFRTGGKYNPITDSWIATSVTNVPDGREMHTAVWTGTEMIVWGGTPDAITGLNTGGKYNPMTNSWIATSTINAPSGRWGHTAVWTGSKMIVWGGNSGDNTGGRYNPSTDSWMPTSTTNAPGPRVLHTAVWTDSEMIVWGGNGGGSYLNTGGRYNPGTDSWTSTSITNAPDGREQHTAVWTGSEMFVWGGYNGSFFNTGETYNPMTDTWTATSSSNAPEARAGHTAVRTDSEMIVWGGVGAAGRLNSGARYGPNGWTPTSLINAPSARNLHTAVWTTASEVSEMIIWGGAGTGNIALNTGGRYCAAAAASPTPTPTSSPTSTATATATATPTATVRPTPTPRIAPTPRARPTPAPRP